MSGMESTDRDFAAASNEDRLEELLVAAYKRGFQWGVENMGDPEATAYVGKAARDYADYTMNTPSTEVGTLRSGNYDAESDPISLKSDTSLKDSEA